MERTLLALLLALAMAACSERNPTYSDDDAMMNRDGLSVADSGPGLDSRVSGADSRAKSDGGGITLDGAPGPVDGPLAVDGTIASCTHNSQCGPTQYCKFGFDCGQAWPGTCASRPGPCPEIYSPVCGCDGKTYSSECHAAEAGVSVANKGKCNGNPNKCDALNQTYVAAVKAAKVCAPMLPVAQCQVKVASALHCGCPTYVEQGNTQAIAALKKAEQDFKALGCVPYQCGMPCPVPKPGNCALDPNNVTSGSCK